MSEFRIFETEEFQKRLAKLSATDQKLVKTKLTEYAYPQLKEEPFFGTNIKKLKGYDPDIWRYRIGNYRVFYLIEDEEKIIYILTLDARKDAYKKNG